MAAWNDNATTTALTMVKTDLRISASETAYDTRLTQYINANKSKLIRQGITDLSDSVDDIQLVAGFAAWEYRHRESGEPLPDFLRKARNERIFALKMKTETS